MENNWFFWLFYNDANQKLQAIPAGLSIKLSTGKFF